MPGRRHLINLLTAFGTVTLAPGLASAQGLDRCGPATAFVTDRMEMVARVDADTLDDWRTGQRLAACRVTAAGTRRRTRSLAVAARVFYEALRADGWARTPDPADAPNESSMRFRRDATDCLFNVYQGILLGTPAEIEVTNEATRRAGEALYHVLAICVPAMPAAPEVGPPVLRPTR